MAKGRLVAALLEMLLYIGLLVCLGALVTYPSSIIWALVGIPIFWWVRKYPEKSGVFRVSFAAAVGAELFVVLVFRAWLITWTKWLLAKHRDLYSPPLLMASIFAALLPSTLGRLATRLTLDQEGANGEPPPGPGCTVGETANLAPICVIALAFRPTGKLGQLWSWINLASPHRSMAFVLLWSGLIGPLRLSLKQRHKAN
jgi:hypothetical protein